MYKTAKQGWYKLLNPDKIIKPLDNHMKSFRMDESGVFLEYKSSLELKAIRYCDFNKFVTHFALEPFPIHYIKPTDGKKHRYFVDLFIEFNNKDKFIVEIKPKSETIQPKKPKANSQKAMMRYQKAIQTFAVNQAKWEAAKKFADEKNIKFIILTDEELN